MTNIQIRPVVLEAFTSPLQLLTELEDFNARLEGQNLKPTKLDSDDEAKLRNVEFYIEESNVAFGAFIESCKLNVDGDTYSFTVSICAQAHEWLAAGVDLYEQTKVQFGRDVSITAVVYSSTNYSQHYTYTAEIDHFEVGDV